MTHVEIEITAELVRDLVRDQHPDLADRPVRLGAPRTGQPPHRHNPLIPATVHIAHWSARVWTKV